MSRNLRRAGLAEFIMDIIPVAALTAQPVCPFLSTACTNRKRSAGPGCPLPCNYNVPRKNALYFPLISGTIGKNQVIRYKDREVDFHETQSRRDPDRRSAAGHRSRRSRYRLLRPAYHADRPGHGHRRRGADGAFLLRRADRRSGDGRADRNGGPDGDHFARGAGRTGDPGRHDPRREALPALRRHAGRTDGPLPRHGGRGRHARGAGTHARRRAGVFRAEHRIGRAGHADAADHAELQQDPAAAGRG